MNVKVLRYANMKKNIFEKGFKFFLEILKKNRRLYKESLSQFFLAIFHTSWVPWEVWENAKSFENCTRWSGTFLV